MRNPPRQHAQLDLRHVQPRPVLRRVMDLKPIRQALGLFGSERLIKAGRRMRVQLVHHQHHALRIPIAPLQQTADEAGPLDPPALPGHGHVPPAGQRLARLADQLLKDPMGTGHRLGRLHTTISGSATMTQHPHLTASNRLDYDRTLILAVEVSSRSWVVAAQVPGLRQKGTKQQLAPRADALMAAIEGYKRRAAAAGMAVDRVILTYESGGSGFWLARWLQQHGVEVYVVQPSSVPVDRRMRRAKSDRIDADMLLRTLLAWLRGEPRVCSMVPVPNEATEDARRPMREREELIRARVALVNRIEAVLTVLRAGEDNPLPRAPRERLGPLRTALDQPLPPHARAQIERLLDRLELVCKQVAELEAQRDRAVEGETAGPAERMIQQLVRMRGIGVQTATVLVHEARPCWSTRPSCAGSAT